MEKLWGYPAPVKEASPELTPHSDAVFRPAEATSEKSPSIYRLLRRMKAWPELAGMFLQSCSLNLWDFSCKSGIRTKRGDLIARPPLLVL